MSGLLPGEDGLVGCSDLLFFPDLDLGERPRYLRSYRRSVLRLVWARWTSQVRCVELARSKLASATRPEPVQPRTSVDEQLSSPGSVGGGTPARVGALVGSYQRYMPCSLLRSREYGLSAVPPQTPSSVKAVLDGNGPDLRSLSVTRTRGVHSPGAWPWTTGRT